MQEVLSVRVDTSSDDDGEDMVDERKLKRFDDDDTSSDEAGPADNKAGSSSSDDERTKHAADARKRARQPVVEHIYLTELASAGAWGRKRAAFYNTDYAGDEHAGLSGSEDIEAAELEEQEARSIQLRLDAMVTEDDYMADLLAATKQKQSSQSSKIASTSAVGAHVTEDKSTEEVSVESSLPEVPVLIDELNRKIELINTILKPILDAAPTTNTSKYRQPALEHLQQAMECYAK